MQIWSINIESAVDLKDQPDNTEQRCHYLCPATCLLLRMDGIAREHNSITTKELIRGVLRNTTPLKSPIANELFLSGREQDNGRYKVVGLSFRFRVMLIVARSHK